MNPVFFPHPADFRVWLEANHATSAELFVGFYKKGSGRSGMSYHEAVLEALCFGWIDGTVRRLDAHSYMHRFSPRKPGSIWSKVNVTHFKRLQRAKRIAPAGFAAFAARDAKKTGSYSFERRAPAKPPSAYLRRFKADADAWKFFCAQPRSYQNAAIHLLLAAKREETRERRLATLIADSAPGRRIRALSY